MTTRARDLVETRKRITMRARMRVRVRARTAMTITAKAALKAAPLLLPLPVPLVAGMGMEMMMGIGMVMAAMRAIVTAPRIVLVPEIETETERTRKGRSCWRRTKALGLTSPALWSSRRQGHRTAGAGARGGLRPCVTSGVP